MQAIIFESKNTSTVKETSLPELNAGEVLIQTSASGLCHTDIEILKGNYGEGSYPVIPGHEYSGVVKAVADDVTEFKTGDRVVVDPNISCGTCSSCEKGLFNLCEHLEAYGVTRNGGFAEYSVVSIDNLHPVGDLPLPVAALAEPMACVLNALGVADITKTKKALIFGTGPMGMMLGLALNAKGVSDVTMVDIQDDRIAFAESLGFRSLNSNTEGFAENNTHAYDLCIDATGVPAVAKSLANYTANGGTILFYGVCPQTATIEISPFEVFRRQLKMVGSHSLNKNIPESVEILKKEQDRLAKLITPANSISGVEDFMLGKGAKNSMKVQLIFNN